MAAWDTNNNNGEQQNAGIKNEISTDVSMDMDVDNGSSGKKESSSPPSGPLSGGMQVLAGGADGATDKNGNDDQHFMRIPNLSTAEYSIKIGLTLYKVQQNIYLLDFQKMTGDAFSFMALCANIITELKTLSAASRQQAQQQALFQQQQQQAAAAAAALQQQQAAQQQQQSAPPTE